MTAPIRFLGWAGLVLFLFGVVSYAITGVFDLWTAVHVAGGGALLAAGVGLDFAGLRRRVTSVGTRQRAQAASGTVLFAGIVIAVNILAARYPWRFDVTEKKIHTLSVQTRNVLSGLDRSVELLAFVSTADPSRGPIGDLLARYGAFSPKVRWRFVDPEREPDVADRHGVRRQGVLAASAGEMSAQSSGDSATGITEGVVTNLILKVTRPGPRGVYFISGHGEASVEEAQSEDGAAFLAELCRRENFEVKPLLLSATRGIPDDAVVVVVAGPRKPFLPAETSALRQWSGAGGRLLLLLDPGVEAGLEDLLADLRLALGDDMIVDTEQIPFLGARLGLDPIVEDFPPHAISRDFKERIVLSQARSVEAKTDGGLPGVTASVVARTRPSSWAAADWRSILDSGQVNRREADRPGPVAVAAASETEADRGSEAPDPAGSSRKKIRAVLVGDSDFARNERLAAYFNREFLLNSLQWLAGNDDLVAEGPKGFRPSSLDMTEADYRNLFRFAVLLLPELLLIVGLAVGWRRRAL